MTLNRPLRLSALLLISTVFCHSIAPAQDATPRNFRPFALTISPIHLLLPVVELTAEYMAMEHLGLAVVGGAGSITEKNPVAGNTDFSVIEAGGQVRYYPFMPSPHGFQVGAEVLWLHISGSPTADISGTGAGLAVGPFAGYKYTADNGFTFDSQLGYEFITAKEKASSSSGISASAKQNDGIPLLNLNVGWSFGGK